jgi:hypothetical protein
MGTAAIGSAGNEWRNLSLLNIMRRIQGGVDPPAPEILSRPPRLRQFELESLPISVDDHNMKYKVLVSSLRGECQPLLPRLFFLSALE